MDRSPLQIRTERWLRIAQFGHTARGLAWKPPLVAYDDDTFDLATYVVEWWTGTKDETKGLTIWFDDTEIYWIKSDREHLSDGYVTCPQDISRLLIWLLCEREAGHGHG